MESSLSLLAALGIGGAVGGALAAWTAASRLAEELADVRAALEEAAHHPDTVDVRHLIEELRDVEREAKSLFGALRRLVRR